ARRVAGGHRGIHTSVGEPGHFGRRPVHLWRRAVVVAEATGATNGEGPHPHVHETTHPVPPGPDRRRDGLLANDPRPDLTARPGTATRAGRACNRLARDAEQPGV